MDFRHGVSIAVGRAYGLRLKENPRARVYCILGDGELNEGNVWEAAMAPAAYHLDNLIAIIDYNKVMAKGFVWDLMPIEPLKDKWKSFGWDVLQVDGHDIEALCDIFYRAANPALWKTDCHHCPYGKGRAWRWRNSIINGTPMLLSLRWLMPCCENSPVVTITPNQVTVSWLKTMRRRLFMEESKPLEMRDVFGQTLVELGKKYPNMLVLDADLHTSSKAGYFKAAYPDRFLQVGIAEQNLFGIAGGLALEGFVPFPSTFASFVARRALDQVAISICYPRLTSRFLDLMSV